MFYLKNRKNCANVSLQEEQQYFLYDTNIPEAISYHHQTNNLSHFEKPLQQVSFLQLKTTEKRMYL